ncbi:hypothetical protein KPL74_10795 [Bacillus sp. NP157]|nr:hypothetical protein KPL74_10795 [Bacillus sp. NP157]
MDDLKSFTSNGARILDATAGDLTGAGCDGMVLVLDQAGAQRRLGEGPARSVVLVVRDGASPAREVASNPCLVPSATSGGVAGDPFGYVSVRAGQVTIVNGGGSRERWSDEFVFAYDPASDDWLAHGVVRQVMDTETGVETRIELGAADLGGVSFRDFDPSKLPEATLP